MPLQVDADGDEDDELASDEEQQPGDGNQASNDAQQASEGQDSGDEEDDDGQGGDQVDHDGGPDEEYDPVQLWHPRNPYRVRMDLPDLLSENVR